MDKTVHPNTPSSFRSLRDQKSIMAIAVPNQKEVIGLLNSLWRDGGVYLSQDDFQVKRLIKLANRLLKTEAAVGWVALAGAAALTGDVDLVRVNGDRAIGLSSHPAVLDGKATPLSNLGYFSEAQALTEKFMSVETLVWPEAAEKAIACASVIRLAELIRAAGSMQTGIAEAMRTNVLLAAEILVECDVTDRDVAGWLDIAGEIMQAKRMFFSAFPLLFASRDEEYAQVDISFILEVGPEEAARLNRSIVEVCVERAVATPDCFSFGFRSRRVLNECIAA